MPVQGMGTEVQCKSSFEGYYSMGDVNEDSNSSSWPLCYGENTLTNSHYYNGFIPRTVADANPGCDKEVLKHRMLEHEAIFKNQVYELHRIYRIQRDMMEEIKRNEYHKQRISIDASSSSFLLPSQKPYVEGQKWHIPNFPLFNSCAKYTSNSPLSYSQGNNNNNNGSLKDCEIMESRPSKVRKKLFDLELPPDDNIDHEHEEHKEIQCKQASEESSYKDASSRQCFRESGGLADLNEPINVEEPTTHGLINGLGPSSKPNGLPFLDPIRDLFDKSQNGAFNPLLHPRETVNARSNINFTPGIKSEISTIVQDNSSFTPLPFPALRASNSSPYMNPADLGHSCGKSNGSLTHKLTSFQKQPSFLSSPQSHMVFGDKWRMNGCYTPNGFYNGSPSGSKDPSARLPAGGFDHQNYNNLDNRSQKMIKGSNFIDLTDPTKGTNLNNDSNSLRKSHQPVLPWLQARPNITKNEHRCDLGNNKKIPGFSAFGNSCISKNEPSSLVSTSASLRCPRETGKIKTGRESRGFDINVAWDDHENKQIDLEDFNKETDIEVGKIKNHFDLNSCLTEDADVLVPVFVKSSSEKVKKNTMEIDLEAPAVPEAEEEEAIDEVKKIDHCDDEFLAKMAAEAIVVMTGISCHHDQARSLRSNDDDHLIWFAEVIENAGLVSHEPDEYEELTLQQELTKEEDYMPKPLALKFQEPDEAGPARPRRGQTRRGRPRRDFQRDILLGLVSLSRHEVNEDLQIFGGLMRAIGHSWNAGLTRRNGTKGKRKSVVVAVEPPPPVVTPSPPPPPPLLEVVELQEGSLTGWGKTTRRPRRQRCATGTSTVVPLM